MRKQYHFQPSEKGINAWDVHNLIQLSKNIKTKDILIENIKELDENYWFEDKQNKLLTCRNIAGHCQLIMEANLNFPIIISSNGKVMDGMHRICRAYIEGRSTITAKQFKVDPQPTFTNVLNTANLPY